MNKVISAVCDWFGSIVRADRLPYSNLKWRSLARKETGFFRNWVRPDNPGHAAPPACTSSDSHAGVHGRGPGGLARARSRSQSILLAERAVDVECRRSGVRAAVRSIKAHPVEGCARGDGWVPGGVGQ